jgi:hypothetical protein
VSNLLIDRYHRTRLDEGRGEASIKKELLLWSSILDKANLLDPLKRHWPKFRLQASDVGQAISREMLQHLAKVAETNWCWAEVLCMMVLGANAGCGEAKSNGSS